MDSFPQPPDDPLPLAQLWLDEAAASGRRNPWAMSLATVSQATGQPSNRFVLLKGLDIDSGFAIFYTNYESRKALELEAVARSAAALYWPEAGRQLRLEGRVCRSPAAESDAYFATRPRESQLNAWASEQSQPLPADGLWPALDRHVDEFDGRPSVPRPHHWGGYRLWLEGIEFWIEGSARFHERLRYERRLCDSADGGIGGEDWRHIRLQP